MDNLKVFWINTKDFFTKMGKHHISEYTAQCAYYTVLSFIPFIMLIVTLIQYTGISQRTLVSIIQQFMPETMNETTVGIIQEVYSKSVGTISISAIFVLWSAKRGFHALSKGLHQIYETNKEYNYFIMQVKSIIITVFFALTIISVLVLSVFGNIILELIRQKYSISNSVSDAFHISKFGIYFVLFMVILLMYRFVPGHKKSILKQVPGALVATIGWFTISSVFSVYLDTFKGFSVMYGSLTTIVLAMMWVYFCMYIILIGAEINNFTQLVGTGQIESTLEKHVK